MGWDGGGPVVMEKQTRERLFFFFPIYYMVYQRNISSRAFSIFDSFFRN